MKNENYALKDAIAKLNELLSLDKKDIYTIYWFAILAGLLGLSLPLGIQTIIGFVQTNSLSASLMVMIALVLMGTFFIGLLQIRQMQLLEKVKQKIFVRYALEYSDRIPNLDLEKQDNQYLPELVNRFFDTVSLQKGLSKLLLDMPAAVIQILFGIILLAFYSPVFIAFGLLLIIVLILILRLTSQEGINTAMKASHYKYNMAAWLQDLARGIGSFKFAKQSFLHMSKTDSILGGFLNARTRFFKVMLRQFWTLIAFKVLITAAMLIVGAFLLLDNQMSVGQFVAAEIVIVSIISSVEKLIGNLDTVYDALVSVEKLSAITNADIEHSGTLAISPSSQEGMALRCENLSYTYPGGQSALSDVSFSVLPGQIAVVIGASGSGKSTLLQLFTGAFNSYQGKILIDDVPLYNYDLHLLRNSIGALFTQQDIFKGTLLENITMGDKTIEVAQISKLAKQLGIMSFIQDSFDGFDTELDPVGLRLTNKVKQSILLLRALLGNHRLLLLESPFEYLSADNVQALTAYLQSNSHITSIITSTGDCPCVAVADVILNLENGRLKNN